MRLRKSRICNITIVYPKIKTDLSKRHGHNTMLNYKRILLLSVLMFFLTPSANYASGDSIPDWVRNIFIWYGEGQIGEEDLLNALQKL